MRCENCGHEQDDLDEEYEYTFIDWPDLAERQLEYNKRNSKIIESMSEING